MQKELFITYTRPSGALLKWIGSKFKYASIIASHFPRSIRTYYEPFVGTASVCATVAPVRAVAGDTLTPLIDLWKLVVTKPICLDEYYEETIIRFNNDRQAVYDEIKAKYNSSPNPFDLLIISRTCYGGVMRFTKTGEISTPLGAHKPIDPASFRNRLYQWNERLSHVEFLNQSFDETIQDAGRGDFIYCDPPYVDSQKILYGAQHFDFDNLIYEIEKAKTRGAKIALSIDGTKKSGKKSIQLNIPAGLFEQEIFLNIGGSMLKRFQNGGSDMSQELVTDRLLLSYSP